MNYPTTQRGDDVDSYHGVEVSDPYRWLEGDVRESSATSAWVAAQNALAQQYLSAIPERESIRRRLSELWNFARYSSPRKVAGRYFYSRNDGLQNQAVLYVADRYDATGEMLVDPNSWTPDGTASMGQFEVSEDGRRLAYTRKDAGSDWSTVYVMDVASGQLLEDRLEWVRHGNLVFTEQGDGLYYVRYPEPAAGEKFQALSLNPAIYFHRLGSAQRDDQLVYRSPDQPHWSFWLTKSDDQRYLILSIYRSTDPQNQVLVRRADAAPADPFDTLIGDFENQFSYLGNVDSRFYFLTDFHAPTKRIIAMDAAASGREAIREAVPADKGTLESASLVGNQLICQYLEDVATRVKRHSLEGKFLGEIPLPGVGAAGGFTGRQTDEETFYFFTSYTTPTSIYRYDLKADATERIRSPQIDFNPELYESRSAFVSSKDGTQIPIIITHRRGLPRQGNAPTLLYAYGGFSISLTPAFRVDYAAWMERGGILAVANLRGGGEYGEAWHVAGKKTQKQNVFDDFIASAEWLIAEKYTKPAKLAIMGGSNGGLLVGACMVQRPDLFGACLPAVGVMDMLRYHRFTAGHFWRDEYGTADDAQEFQALRAYSPYHNVKTGSHYPATMVITADTDDRVVPMHSFKFAAALQHAQGGAAPILLRVESRAGHGAGSPVSKLIDQAADKWAFLSKALEITEP